MIVKPTLSAFILTSNLLILSQVPLSTAIGSQGDDNSLMTQDAFLSKQERKEFSYNTLPAFIHAITHPEAFQRFGNPLIVVDTLRENAQDFLSQMERFIEAQGRRQNVHSGMRWEEIEEILWLATIVSFINENGALLQSIRSPNDMVEIFQRRASQIINSMTHPIQFADEEGTSISITQGERRYFAAIIMALRTFLNDPQGISVIVNQDPDSNSITAVFQARGRQLLNRVERFLGSHNRILQNQEHTDYRVATQEAGIQNWANSLHDFQQLAVLLGENIQNYPNIMQTFDSHRVIQVRLQQASITDYAKNSICFSMNLFFIKI